MKLIVAVAIVCGGVALGNTFAANNKIDDGDDSEITSPALPLAKIDAPAILSAPVPTWSADYAFDLAKPHTSFAILDHTLKAKSDLFGLKSLSAMSVAFAGTPLNSKGITAGLGGELAYSLGNNLYLKGGLGYAAAPGTRPHAYWILGASAKF